jgi:hypothetical protein
MSSSNHSPGSDASRRTAWPVHAASGLVALLYLVACLHGIANYWQWGHNGYNGAAFSQAARNSLRFHMAGQAQYHTDLRPPRPEAMYVHHPLALHFHLIAVYLLAGFHEWAGRLIPALYSVLTLVLIWFMVRRMEGPGTALVAITIFALTPINLIFANMINHEQGGIFWCLLTVDQYLRWIKSGRRRHLLGCIGAVTMAVQFDWPGYYIAFFIALHAMVTGIMRGPGLLRWRRETTFVLLFSLAVLANLVFFFLYIAILQGNLNQMKDAFFYRTAEVGGYYPAIWHRTRQLQGWIPMTLGAGWVVLLVGELARGRSRLVHMVPLLFLFAQVIHSVVFKQAGIIHAYWTYYASPAIAVGGAVLVVALARALREAAGRIVLASGWHPRRPWAQAALLAAVVAAAGVPLLAYQGRAAFKRMRWGFATGAAAYNPDYSDQFGEIMWAKQLARRYPRPTVRYLVDASVDWRIEFAYYIDSPITPTAYLGFGSAPGASRTRSVLLVDLKRSNAGVTLSKLFEKYKAAVWDRRFVAFEQRPPGPGPVEAYVSEGQPAPLWWRWLVNPNRPPIRWVPDPDPGAVASLFNTTITLSADLRKGGYGGGPMAWDCPAGHVMSGCSSTTIKTKLGGVLLSAVKPLCRKMTADLRTAGAKAGEVTGPWLGRWAETGETKSVCRQGDLPVGMKVYVSKGSWVAGLAMMCAGVLSHAEGEGGEIDVKLAPAYRSVLAGREAGPAYDLACPAGSVVWGFTGRGGDLVDAAGVTCVRLDAGFLEATNTVVGTTPWKMR